MILLLPGAAVVRAEDQRVIDEDFEGDLPEFHTYRATYGADDARSHGGKRSLRVTPKEGGGGGAYFKLDGLIDPELDYEFSAWVWTDKANGVRLYISASDGKTRHIVGDGSGGLPGAWTRVVGRVRRQEWKSTDTDIMLAMVASSESWVDDVTLTGTIFPLPPLETYPPLQALLRTEADRRVSTLPDNGPLRLSAAMGALAPDISRQQVVQPDGDTVLVPADGLLTFALDVPRATYVTGTVSLVPDDDLRPGLRAYALCDATVLAAPMVVAPAWQGQGHPMRGPVPSSSKGERPPNACPLVEWLLPQGRHYLTVAGPHVRSAGTFEYLQIEALRKPVASPVYQFALLSDTHVGEGRSRWMNVKMDGPGCAELGATLKRLAEQGTAFAFIAGDMTDGATRPQFEELGRILAESGLPVFGCAGNHDSYHASSRSDAMELCQGLFPQGTTDYALAKPPIRFLVLDGSYWKSPEGTFMDHYENGISRGVDLKSDEIDWLRKALAEDTTTPTIVVWHYPVFRPGGASSCGFQLPAEHTREPVCDLLRQAPNVVATLCGHTHWNAVSVVKGITHIQNAAFVEWPNAYRVFRVYPDRLEWETRQVGNRGFVRESFSTDHALSWMISTGDHDLAGTLPLTR